jgi:ATP diphosphatase
MSDPKAFAPSKLDTALQMLDILRDPARGCPWLSSRKFEDLIPYFFEELHEYRQAAYQNGQNSPELRQELADLLFQTLLHSLLLKEKTGLTLEDLAQDVIHKLERRHPHVFDPTHPKFHSAEEASKAWEELKLKEAAKAQRTQEALESPADKLERIPHALPALQRAARIGEKTQGFGFDWEKPEDVFVKVEEEFEELKAASTLAEKREELGDLFFILAQYARHLGLPAEEVADEANRKFLSRYRKMQTLTDGENLQWSSLSSDQKEALWKRAKKL